jgi:hypothetical protein
MRSEAVITRSFWWELTDLADGAVYRSDETAFGTIPMVERVDLENGHVMKSQLVFAQSGPVAVDLRSGLVWFRGQVVDVVGGAKRRLILRRHVEEGAEGEASYAEIGLVNEDGVWAVAKIHDWRRVEFESSRG